MIDEILSYGDLAEGWDGESAARPHAGAIREAVEFVRGLGRGASALQPTLHVDGSVILEMGGGSDGSLRFAGDGTVSYALSGMGRGTFPVADAAAADWIRQVIAPSKASGRCALVPHRR